MIVSAHQPQYLPWSGYFDKIAKSDCFVFLDQVQYKQREFQNRNKIKVKDGWAWLTVPVKTKYRYKQPIRDALVDNGLSWGREHLHLIKAWYADAPYFGRYKAFLEDVYWRSWEKLRDLNAFLIKYVMKELDIDRPVYFESELSISSDRTDRIIDICRRLGANTYLAGVGCRAYLQEDKFISAGIKLVYHEFKHPEYKQLHGARFIPCLSVFDLLLNEGDNAKSILGLKQATAV